MFRNGWGADVAAELPSADFSMVQRADGMNIGLVPSLNPSFGGSHQYSLAMLEAVGLLAAKSPDNTTYNLFIQPKEKEILSSLNCAEWSRVVLHAPLSDRIRELLKTWIDQGALGEALRMLRRQATHKRFQNPDQVRRGSKLGKSLKRHGIDWVLYTDTDSNSFESGVPYVMPVFDLQHRFQPMFPEVSRGGEWNEREYVFRNGTREALLILADSEVGKEDILDCYGPYGVTPDRVKVLPYVPAPYLSPDVPSSERARVRATYRLPERYLLYPAQLWPHKNHVRLVQALGLLKADNPTEIHLVLCGTHSGAIRTQVFQEMMREVHRLQVAAQVHYLGYVPNEDMSALYAEAAGLVMPTFFGPTNIPVIEAWLFGCPVMTSDIRGVREQVGDAGLLVEPRSVEAIAAAMGRLWNEEGLRTDLVRRGTQRLTRHSRRDFCIKLAQIVAEASQRVTELRSPRCRPLSAENNHWKAAS